MPFLIVPLNAYLGPASAGLLVSDVQAVVLGRISLAVIEQTPRFAELGKKNGEVRFDPIKHLLGVLGRWWRQRSSGGCTCVGGGPTVARLSDASRSPPPDSVTGASSTSVLNMFTSMTAPR